jgi:hypothetical protein
MIPRTLVPVNVRPITPEEARKTPHRLTTYMDDRTVVPSGPSEAPPLDGKTTIPAHLPLGVLVDHTLVPRGMPVTQIERPKAPSSVALNVLDSRFVVPSQIEPLTKENTVEFERPVEMTAELQEIVKPDIFTTGNANLLIEPEAKKDPKSDLITRVLSIAVHIVFIVFLIFLPKIFPAHVPTQEELDMARQELSFVDLPPDVAEPAPPRPHLQLNRNTLEKVAPTIEQPKIPNPVPPAPERPAPELPDAPRPQIPVTSSAAIPAPPAPSHLEPVAPSSPNSSHLNLGLSQVSPGEELARQENDAIRNTSRGGGTYGGQAAPGGSGGPGMNGSAQILSDTQGVDFSNYINRLLATLYRNWMVVMPESARMGDKGIVYTIFQINPDGSIAASDPELERTSGKEPLDNAAMSAIHASNPFEPLPSQFHGPFLKLRIAFIYNIPREQVDLH